MRIRKNEAKPFIEDALGIELLSSNSIVEKSKAFNPVPGIYFLIKDSEVVYVGQSINVYSRVNTHSQDKDFNKIHVLPCGIEELDDLESAYIHHLHPRLNGRTARSVRAPIVIDELLERSEKYQEYKTAVFGRGRWPHKPKIDWLAYLKDKQGMSILIEDALPPPRPSCWGWPKKIRTVYFKNTGSYLRQKQGESLSDFHDRFCELINALLGKSIDIVTLKSDAYQFLKPRG
tara:strand:- start:226 stop:921 length:696 start_codon:yes stop_codon:yes gene_type:complete